jgi:PAS domain S-box-containing protein
MTGNQPTVGDDIAGAFAASQAGILLATLDGQPLSVNRAFCAMVDRTAAEVRQLRWTDLVVPADAGTVQPLLQQMRAGALEHYQLDLRFVRRNGTVVWGRVSVSLAGQQPVPCAVAVVQDLSDRMIVQDTLELAPPDSIRVTRCSRDFRFLWVSPGYAAWLGRPVADFLGRPIADVLGDETFQWLRPKFERVLAGELLEYETVLNLPEVGRRWVAASCAPTRDSAGVVDGWIGVITDVTSRKAAEEEVLRQALIVESTGDAVLSRSLNGLVLSWNDGARRLFGYAEGDVVGRPFAMMVPGDLLHEEEAILARVRQGEHIERYETTRLRNGGTPVDVSVTISPVRNHAGEIIGVCDIVRDITDRKQIERVLRWSLAFERMVSDLSRTFISLPDDEIEANVHRSLAQIGTCLDLDRVTLYDLPSAGGALEARWTWTKPGIVSTPVPLATGWAPWWTAWTRRGEEMLVSGPEDFPEDAVAELNYFRRAALASVASMPLRAGTDVTGAVVFVTLHRQITWTDELVAQLRIIADIFSNALKRKVAMDELRATQAATRESEERFRLVANTTPAMIWMSGPDTGRTYSNQSLVAFAGRAPEALLGHGWTEHVHPEDLPGCWSAYAAAFERRERFEVEYRVRRHDGVYRWLVDDGVPRFEMDGSFAGYIGSCVDVTDRKDAESMRSNFSLRLIQAQEEERAGVSRELHDDINQRVVLAALRLEALRGLRDVPDAAKEQVARVVEQLGELSSDIQALSHRLHNTKLEQLGIRAAATGFCREVAAQHGIQIEFEAAGIPDRLRPDISVCVFRVLQEALQNATKHSAASRVDVSLAATAAELQLIVKDAGRGFRIDEASRGSGIGLTNMRERLRLVQGTLSIATTPGEGTTLTARVPLDGTSVTIR